ncbi:rhombotin-1 isoform X1 [Stegostoma tigrinum]|uniref:rhombotin-1 isoform X1 n=2 Tax=Stegostoma tigrinum TaxID=3053191 RepID=UPI00202B7638|nr:rhombotin-1 isoform X1 [Stegostoma tigrinum]
MGKVCAWKSCNCFDSAVRSCRGDVYGLEISERITEYQAASSYLQFSSRGVPMLSVQPKGKQKGCAGCSRKIKDRYLLKALDKYWHEDCLKCACCDCRLGEVGSTLYTKANLILCRRDYLRLFGTTGNCAACSKLIPAFEMVMRARENVYHLDCFACQLCNQRFCVGDKFFLKNNMILCQMDYEEGAMNGSFSSQVQ